MIRQDTRIEVGVVGVPPRPEQLRPPPLPETVVMNFGKLCNLWCAHCFFPGVTLAREARQADGAPEPVLLLPYDTMRAVADEMAAWETPAVLRIAADGEPLVNPRALDMVAYAKQRGVTVSLTTNGITLTPPTIARLLETGIDVIDVSIDAATPETYAQVRPGRNGFNFYRIVERNVRALIAARDAADPPGRTRVMVNLIDQPLAHADVTQFTRQWREWGADAVLIRPFHSTSAQTSVEGAATASPDVARFPCKFPFTRLNVGFDEEGHPVVYYCSHDWTEQTVVGTLGRDGSLRDIWHGAAMNDVRQRHLTNTFPAGSLCAQCPDWFLGWGKSHHKLVTDLQGEDD